MGILVALYFFEADGQEKGLNFYGSNFIVFSL